MSDTLLEQYLIQDAEKDDHHLADSKACWICGNESADDLCSSCNELSFDFSGNKKYSYDEYCQREDFGQELTVSNEASAAAELVSQSHAARQDCGHQYLSIVRCPTSLLQCDLLDHSGQRCNQLFAISVELEVHQQEQHRFYICQICRCFETLGNALEHFDRHHAHGIPYSNRCWTCSAIVNTLHHDCQILDRIGISPIASPQARCTTPLDRTPVSPASLQACHTPQPSPTKT